MKGYEMREVCSMRVIYEKCIQNVGQKASLKITSWEIRHRCE
jgi:hypothetical protein